MQLRYGIRESKPRSRRRRRVGGSGGGLDEAVGDGVEGSEGEEKQPVLVEGSAARPLPPNDPPGPHTPKSLL